MHAAGLGLHGTTIKPIPFANRHGGSFVSTVLTYLSSHLLSLTFLLTDRYLLSFSPVVAEVFSHLLSISFFSLICHFVRSHILFVFWVVDITSNSLTPHVPRTTLSFHSIARTIGEMFLLNVADAHWAMASNFGKVTFPLMGVETRGKS